MLSKLFGLVAPFAAALMERFGIRRVVMTALTVVSVGSGLTIFIQHPWHLIATAKEISARDQPNASSSGTISTEGADRNPAVAINVTKVTAAAIHAGWNLRVLVMPNVTRLLCQLGSHRPQFHLMRSSNFIIPTEVAGSKFPVGSSAIKIVGRDT